MALLKDNRVPRSFVNLSSRVIVQVIVCLFLTIGFVAAQGQPANSISDGGTPAVSGPGATGGNRLPAIASAPSKTPTPKFTPESRSPARAPLSPLVSIPGQTQVDADTVALYHFDAPSGSNAIDATGHFTGTMVGDATIASSGLYGGVLQIDGRDGTPSYIRTGNLGTLNSGTIEGFVDFATACNPLNPTDYFTIFSAGGEFGSSQQPALWLGDQGYLRFYFYANNKLYLADSTINPCRYLNGSYQGENFGIFGLPVLWPYETWRFHHVAGTWGPRGIEIWVDGVLHGVGLYVPDPNNLPDHNGFSCSPQQQEGSAYPKCNAPHMGLVPGSYGGGLLSYSTFLIGCGSNPASPNADCFRGRIDEVRISSVQRQFDVTLIPTITPTPTQTPVPITGAYSLDPQTTALYHLDSVSYSPGVARAIDETGAHNAVLMGQTALTFPGRFGNAYYLDGNGSYFYYGDLGNPASGAVEAWVNLTGLSSQYAIISAGFPANSNGEKLDLGVDWGGSTLRFGINDSNQWYWADSGMTPAVLSGCWHHVAGTWGQRGLEVWVDGVLRGSAGYTGNMGGYGSTFPYLFGCDGFGRCMGGKMDEVRISSVQRRFTPNSPAFSPNYLTNQNLTAPRRTSPSIGQAPGASGTLSFIPFVGVVPSLAPPPCTFGS